MPRTVSDINPETKDNQVNAMDHDTPPNNLPARHEAHDEVLEEELLESWDHSLFKLDGRVDREAAIVFGLLTDYDFFTFAVEDIAAVFLWDVSRAKRALDRLEEGLAEAHRRFPDFFARMMVIRDPHRVWIHVLPEEPVSLGRL